MEIKLALKKAELRYQEAQQRTAVTKKMYHLAEQSAELSRERFREGLVLASDLIDTEARLTEAQIHYAAAQARYHVAVANVRRAAGWQQFDTTTTRLLEGRK